MLGRNDLIGFVPITDAERARTFYVETLGLAFAGDDGFAIVIRANGRMIRLIRVGAFTPAPYTILGWESAHIESEVHGLTAAGIVFERYPHFPQDAQGIWTAPNGNKVAWFKDPDGNVLSLSQHDA